MKKPAILGGDPVRSRPFAPRKTMGIEEENAARDVVRSGVLSVFLGSPGPLFVGGPRVLAFERKWAEMYGFRHAISVNSWTAGLTVCVGAISTQPGDEIICSPYTMSASATCALFYGAVPVFADIDPVTFCLDPESIEARITPRTRAIVVVHLFGHPADMDRIMEIAGRHGLRVIEDGAQSPGVLYKGRPVGAIGDLGGFSLNYHKHIHTGEGGMIVTNDDDLAERCRLIRNHGEMVADVTPSLDLCNVVGGNFRLTELQAAIGVAQLDRLEGYLSHRRELAAALTERIEDLPGIAPQPAPEDGSTHGYYVFPIGYDADRAGLSRELFVKAVLAELPPATGAEDTALIPGYVRPLYWSRIYQEKRLPGFVDTSLSASVCYDKGICPVAERMYERGLLYSPVVREPLTVDDMTDFAHAMETVLQHADEIGKAFPGGME